MYKTYPEYETVFCTLCQCTFIGVTPECVQQHEQANWRHWREAYYASHGKAV
jgi:hypothetical protein